MTTYPEEFSQRNDGDGPMRALMMEAPLLVSSILKHAATYHGDTEIVSRTAQGAIHRTTYRETWKRSQQLANALRAQGLNMGDRVGTLAYNGHRHLELYFGSAGAGFVCHTINPRLLPAQIAYIINHAADRVLFIEPGFLELIETIADSLPCLEAVVVMTDKPGMPPSTRLSAVLCYEELLEAASDIFAWLAIDENSAAGLCYTSGTTGDPKGVLYSHRSIVLHAISVCLPDAFALQARSVIMPVVPMFHVNAWGLPHAAPLVGAKLVLPGPLLDGANLHALIEAESVSFTAGVPTVWMGLLDWTAANHERFHSLERVAIGGSACPPVILERFRALGVDARQAWGMTETSPVSLVNSPKTAAEPDPAKQGRPLYGVELRIVDDEGHEVAQDGTARGTLFVRGPWIASDYYRRSGTLPPARDGWFDTADVVTINAEGFVQIVDRTKDVIKSGGEWISSIELENVAMSHPAVQQAAALAMPDPRWGERPLLVIVPRAHLTISEQDVLDHFIGKVPRWSIPDKIVFADELPLTATGKLNKIRLRKTYCV